MVCGTIRFMEKPAVDEFPVVGEPLALDLINTRVRTAEGETDLLATPAALRAWLGIQAERLPQPDAPISAAELALVHAIREDIATAIRHAQQARHPPARALRALTDAQRVAPAYRELAWDGAVVASATRRDGDYGARLVAELAEAAAELLTSPAIAAVRQCDGPGCVLLFLPAHPRRRWCSPKLCGNRVRVARYYQRHKIP